MPRPAAPDAPIGQRIDESYAELSPQEQRAADVILAHLDDLALYNASEIARLSSVSKATVSRLFRSLGFADAQEVREHARALRSQGIPLGGVTLDAERSSAIDTHLAQEQSNLAVMLTTVSDGRLGEAAALIGRARRIVVIGLRNSYPVALHLRQQLVLGFEDVRLAPQPGQSIGEELAGLTDGDAVALVGFRRRPSGFGGVLDVASDLRVPVVLLADSSARRHSGRVAVYLECPVDSVLAVDSYAAANSLVALLATESLAVAARDSRTRIASINRLYDGLDELEPRS
ncbi:hypothetical protein B7R22_04520 [Subtercola boreus]|uniref:HTH rpiR-type domain-containing protein n=1 Tax=Subtercola boreus TaxID=120213 RepID=A0A3E0W2Z0_9MICO|nr:MurR/RpiR family transcriptional regulator [Subtercola boreus]RFA16129.1 hypothetical protein B7R22_04520 [Subtercola boreus]